MRGRVIAIVLVAGILVAVTSYWALNRPTGGETADNSGNATSGPSQPGPAELQVRESGAIRNVFFRRGDGEWRNLTQFTRPCHVHDSAVSPSGRYAYVWHSDRPPRQLAVYDLMGQGDLVADFVPGYGGSLQWTVADTILHRWGAGTGARNYVVYDRQGKELLSGGTSGDEVSPDGSYLLTFPTLMASDEPLQVIALRTLTIRPLMTDIRTVTDLQWLDGSTLRMDYRDDAQEERTMIISGLKSGSEPVTIWPAD
ncbi:MAG: hypothetical protein ACLFVU_03240 [Phycisphaerae bacterium]